jgi:hypothetical protein
MELVGQSEGHRHLERRRRKQDYEIKYLKKRGGGVDMIRQTQNRNQWQTSVNTNTKLQFS